ncbi:MAG: hypothetical protein P4L16_05500 [Chlamydiales bacterium]|nr:hypothetical protein [Chlamydiales bacterium]
MVKNKFLFTLLICASSVFVHANDSVSEIYDNAQQIKIDNQWSRDVDEDRLVYEFYAQAIDNLSEEVLQANPELMFRKGLAALDMAYCDVATVEEWINKLKVIKEDFAFVVSYAEPGSRLFNSAKFQIELIDYLACENPKEEEELFNAAIAFGDTMLRQLIQDSTASGLELREEVLANINNSKEFHDQFLNCILITETNPDLALGNIESVNLTILGINTSSECTRPCILCSISYEDLTGVQVTTDVEI